MADNKGNERQCIDKNVYDAALAYATKKHEGQFRIGGEAYITHPLAVAQMLKEKNLGLDYQITGLFHDLLEDTDATEEEILALSNREILQAVKLLTKKKGYVMSEYIAGIKSNSMAFEVKAADRLHNLKSAYCTSEMFKRKYIKETREWYMDFSQEIKAEVEALEASLK
jgi:(p)ppGpp synthase/HD superfamily hydrolase